VGLGAEIEELRRLCTRAVDELCAVEADQLFVIGAGIGDPARSFAPWAPGSGAATVDVPEPLPLPHLVGAHLTGGRSRSFVVVDPSMDPEECAELGSELAASADRIALLVMGDGSARHDVKAPGYLDPRAREWDETVRNAFAQADFDALMALDPAVADELLCTGRAPWQVLAGAATGVALRVNDVSFHVPFGVGYFVARWSLEAGDGATSANSSASARRCPVTSARWRS